MLRTLEHAAFAATRTLSVVGLIALMGLAAMTLADGLMRWLANQPIEPIDRQAAPRDTTGKNNGSCADHLVAIDKYLSRNRIYASYVAGN